VARRKSYFSKFVSRVSRVTKNTRRGASRSGKRIGKSLSRFGAKAERITQKTVKRAARAAGIKTKRAPRAAPDPSSIKYKYTVKQGAAIREKVFQSGNKGAPYLALIINKRLGKEGKPGLHGPPMKEAIEKEWERRSKSIGFIRSGWLVAIRIFARAIGRKASHNAMKAAQRYGMIGGGSLAKLGLNPTATFWNAAFSKYTTTGYGVKFAEQGLQAAINQEVGRMKQQVENRMQADTNKFFGRLLR